LGGTILNVLTVALGSALGLLIGNRLPERVQQSVVTGIGLITLVVGIQNANRSGNMIIPLLSIVIGTILGELLRIDRALERFGGWLQGRFAGGASGESDDSSDRARFINGFVMASLIFCVGPLTFVGSMMDGMGLALGFQQLAIKSVLDGFTALAFAASLGVGVAFSIVTILVLQGGLALVGALLVSGADTAALAQTPAILETTAVGGLLLIALALVLLDVKKPRVANFLPALLVAPLLVTVATALGINIYPL
jgi:uncharacterized membrane protein YqgA involved in biofilm formation